jgi:hypothetical protein
MKTGNKWPIAITFAAGAVTAFAHLFDDDNDMTKFCH